MLQLSPLMLRIVPNTTPPRLISRFSAPPPAAIRAARFAPCPPPGPASARLAPSTMASTPTSEMAIATNPLFHTLLILSPRGGGHSCPPTFRKLGYVIARGPGEFQCATIDQREHGVS